MKYLGMIALLGLLAGCANDGSAPMPHGKWQVLNAGQWDMDPSLVSVPADLPKISNEDK